MILSEQQRKLVEDNHSLIYSFLETKGIDGDKIAMWYGTAAVGLCRAAQGHDPFSQDDFTVNAYLCMEAEYEQELAEAERAYSYITRSETDIACDYSLEAEDFIEASVMKDAIEKALEDLDADERGVVELIIEYGCSLEDAAERLGMWITKASDAYGRFISNMRSYLEV